MVPKRRINELALVKLLYTAVAILVAIVVLVLPGCGLLGSTVIHPVAMETRSGAPLVEQSIPDTGKRENMPENTEQSDIVATINLDNGGQITVKKNEHRTLAQKVTGKQKYNYTLDVKAQEEAKEVKAKTGRNMVESPAPPWWKWPLIIGLGLIGTASLYYLRPILDIIASLFSWIKRRRQ